MDEKHLEEIKLTIANSDYKNHYQLHDYFAVGYIDELVNAYEDYKSRCERGSNALNILVDILNEQPPRNPEDFEWLEDRTLAIENILQVGGKDE